MSAAVVGAALALAACTGGTSAEPPTTSSPTTATIGPSSASPSPSLSPEAKAAGEAKAAYEHYQDTIDHVYQRGGAEAKDEFSKIAFGTVLNRLLDQAEQIRALHWRQIGRVATRRLSVESALITKGKLPQVILSVCTDVSARRIVDSNGKTVPRTDPAHFYRGPIILTRFEDSWKVTNDDSSGVKSC